MSSKSVLLLYGLPCSGKSMVVQSLSDHAVIAVDEIITRIVADPTIEDFQRLAGEIVDEIVVVLQGLRTAQVIIEMGCLITRGAIDKLELFMADADIQFANVVLIASDEELIRRIEKRNADIDAGESNSIKVDGPDYLTRFKAAFENNHPDNSLRLDTTGLSKHQVIEQISENLLSFSIQ